MFIPGSYANGFAPRDLEPYYPQLQTGWVSAMCPSLGVTGTVLRDWCGWANHGTLISMDPSTDWVLSGMGYALDLDGVNDHIDTGSRTWGFTTTGTMSCWIKTATASGNTILSLGRGTVTDEMLLYLGVVAGKVSILNHSSPGNFTCRNSSTSVHDSAWHHVVGVIDGGSALANLRIYVDGKEETGTTTTSGAASDLSDSTARFLRIGARVGAVSEVFSGLIDDVLVYGRALKASEIALLYSGGRGRGIAYAMRQRRRARSAAGRIPSGATMTGGMYVNQCGGMVA